MTGGDAPARMWRQFMQVAHKGIAPHDFDWLLPSVAPPRYEVPMDAAEAGPDYGEPAPDGPDYPDHAPHGGYYDDADAAFARTSADGDRGGWGDADWAEPPVDAPF